MMAKNMTTGSSLRLLLTFMVPLLIGNVFQQLYSIADIIIVGRTIGVNALASVGAAAPLFMLFVVVTMGLSNGFTVLTGQFYGAKDYDKMRRSVAMSTMLCLAFVIIFDIFIFSILDMALRAMNIPEVLYADARSYVAIISYGLWAMMGYNLLSGILRSLGDSKTPLYFLIIATVLNVILALVFIISFGWGVPGSAVALVIAQGVSALLCLIFISKKYPILRVKASDWHFDWQFALEHLRIGVPMGAQFSVMGLGMILIQAVCNKLGPDTIAGFTAAMRVEQLALQPMISFGIAMAVFSAQNYGAKSFDRIRDAVKRCSLVALGFAAVAALSIYIFGEPIINIFIEEGNPQVIEYGVSYLHYSVPFYFFLNQLFIYRGAVQGMGIGVVPLISAFIELCMRTGAAMILAERWGFMGICLASPIAWVVATIFLFCSYRYLIKEMERRHKGLQV